MSVPNGLRVRGAELWAALELSRNLEGGNSTLALEACRIADRLEKLEEILSGDKRTWLHFRIRDRTHSDEVEYTLVMTGVLSEARQQAIVLRQIVAGLPLKGEDDDTDGLDLDKLGMSS